MPGDYWNVRGGCQRNGFGQVTPALSCYAMDALEIES